MRAGFDGLRRAFFLWMSTEGKAYLTYLGGMASGICRSLVFLSFAILVDTHTGLSC